MIRRIFFSVGEPSGDLHAAALLRQLTSIQPTLQARGFGGTKMLYSGLEQDYDLTQLAVVGFVEVLPKLRQFFRCKDQARQILRSSNIDAVVLVDFPGFNWHIAAEANKLGIPVFYYMPPQLWAWGQWRIKKMKRTVDHVICALPFERDYFQSHGMDATLVGHPFFEHVDKHPLSSEFAKTLGHRPSVAVLPGSRNRELQKIWPLQLEIIAELSSRHPEYRFDVACLNEAHAKVCRSIYISSAHPHLPIHIHVARTSEVIAASTCVLAKSGSVSLELLARGKPACVMYHASKSTYMLGKTLSNARFISLPNIIAGKEIVPEYIAVGSSKSALPKIIDSMSSLMGSDSNRNAQIEQLKRVRALCGGSQASKNAAELIFNRLGIDIGYKKAAA